MKRKKNEWDNGSHTPFASTIIIHSNASPARQQEPAEPVAEPTHLSKTGIPIWEIIGILFGCLLVLYFIWNPVLAAKKTEEPEEDDHDDYYYQGGYLEWADDYSDYATGYIDVVLNLPEESPYWALFEWDWSDIALFDVTDVCWTDDPPQMHADDWLSNPMEGKHPDYTEDARDEGESFQFLDYTLLKVDERLFGLSYDEVNRFCLGRLTDRVEYYYGPGDMTHALYTAPDYRMYELFFAEDRLVAVRYSENTVTQYITDYMYSELMRQFGDARSQLLGYYSGEYYLSALDQVTTDGVNPFTYVVFDTSVGKYYASYTVFLRINEKDFEICHQITSQDYYEYFWSDPGIYGQYWYEGGQPIDYYYK
ncbi:MAG: hypothetical protein J5845_07830 [Lachnospiraceae bacterium]|nr:hypothetical protein [Lachnospiraceae bacterium]